MSLFRARGKDTSRAMTIDDMLSYRDAYTQPLPDFNFDTIMIEATRAQQPVPPPTLVTSESGFRHIDVKTLSEEQQYRRKVQSLLNKLTESNADVLIGEILVPELLTNNNIAIVVELIFDKALDEPFFLTTYIKLINALAKYESAQEKSPATPNSAAPSPVASAETKSSVRRSLISKSQAVFESQFEKKSEGLTEEEIDIKRRQEIANVTFVAELLNSGLLSLRVFPAVIGVLFADPPVDLNVELGLKLIAGCGKFIDECANSTDPKTRRYVKPDWFDYIEKIAKPTDKPPTGISFRVWFAAKNLAELRANKWVPKTAPKVEAAPPPPPQPTASPTTSAPPATKDPEFLRRLRDAQPPEWLTEEMKKEVIKKATKDLGKVEGDAPTPAYWEALVADFGSLNTTVLPPICRRAAAFPLIKHFCTNSKDDVRVGLLPMFQKWGANELTHALAWVITDAIVCSDLEDAPKFFDRFAMLLTESVSVPVFDNVFARAGGFLDVMYASEDGEPRWHSEYLKAWDLYLNAVQKSGNQFAPVNKVLDAFAKAFNPFLQIVVVDMIEKICVDGLAKREDVTEWIKAAAKGSDKNRLLADEISILFM